MKRTLIERCLAAFLACLWANAGIAQEECAAIGNDIERLECFDESIQDRTRNTSSPNDHFNKFLDLVYSEHTYGDKGIDMVGASFLDDTCEVAILNISYGTRIIEEEPPNGAGVQYRSDGLPIFGGVTKRVRREGGNVRMVFFDPGEIGAMENYDERRVEISMERGAQIYASYRFDTRLDSREKIRSGFQGLLSAFENDQIPDSLLRSFERKFSYSTNFVTEASQIDRDAIVDALWDLHEACNAAG